MPADVIDAVAPVKAVDELAVFITVALVIAAICFCNSMPISIADIVKLAL